MIFTLGTFYFLLGSVCLVAYFIFIYFNPQHNLNPLKPPVESAPTSQVQLAPVQASATPEAAAAITDTPWPTEAPTNAPPASPAPASTLPPFPTATSVVLNTPAPSQTQESRLFFSVQEGTPSYLPYAGGCNGLYLAGNITDLNNNPVMLMTVRVTGLLAGQEIYREALSGSNQNYTESGWEIKLSDSLANSSGTLVVALYEQGAYEPISEIVLFDTFSDCRRNLVVVNFVQQAGDNP